MKTIDEIIKRTAPERLKEIGAIMEIKGSSEQKIREAFLNIFALNRLLSRLSRDELAILKLLYSDNDGISFSEIHKQLGISIEAIEAATANLSGFMLAYVLKNRQMLNKKMDKLFSINEITELLRIASVQEIQEHIHKIGDALTEKKGQEQAPKADEKLKSIIKKIITRGGIIPAYDMEPQGPDYEQKSTDACRSGLLTYFIIIEEQARVYFSISPSIALWASGLSKKAQASPASVDNAYNLAVNILLAYDVISTSGLFLTKQNKFRKIDLKKISDSMLQLRLPAGDAIDGEDTARLILQLLHIMNCLKLDRDIGVISLKPIEDIIDDPVLLFKYISSRLADYKKRDEFFEGEIPIPPYHDLKTLISILGKIKSAEQGAVKLAFMAARISQLLRKNGAMTAEQNAEDSKGFTACLNFLTLAGIAGAGEGQIIMTETGRRVHATLFGKKYARAAEPARCIYISPDFTLMIPDREMDPSSLYLIMAYTEIHKQDVVIEAAITKSSIINASKRGMNFDKFINTLRQYAKNEIPQNLEFLLTDWTNQTMTINISRPVLLYSSHPSFIDELLYGNTAKAVITRISENYALIEKAQIDDIVKFSRKFDVKLSIFEDSD